MLFITIFASKKRHQMETATLFQSVRQASRTLGLLSHKKIDDTLMALATAMEQNSEQILQANQKDLARKDPSDPMYDRLKLTPERMKGIADGIREVAKLPSPVGRVLDERTRPNGLYIKRISVPFGVIGVIYEARPNVGPDVFSLCFKSGNACILKGGSDAHESNTAIVDVIHNVLKAQGIDPNVIALMPAGHESTAVLLAARGQVDLVIPRGSARLIQFVNDNAKVPVIETGAGTCHIYFDQKGDLEKGADIVMNAKTRRISVCNALDTLIVHSNRKCCNLCRRTRLDRTGRPLPCQPAESCTVYRLRPRISGLCHVHKDSGQS